MLASASSAKYESAIANDIPLPAVSRSMIFPRISGGNSEATIAAPTAQTMPTDSAAFFFAVSKMILRTFMLFFILLFLLLQESPRIFRTRAHQLRVRARPNSAVFHPEHLTHLRKQVQAM